MGRTRMGRTDGQGGDYMLPRNFSVSIKTLLQVQVKQNYLHAFRVIHKEHQGLLEEICVLLQLFLRYLLFF